MALADISQIMNTISANEQIALQKEQLQQQKEEQKQRLEFERQKLDYDHQHQDAVIKAAQALQRAQNFQQLASNPNTVRAMGQKTGQSYSQPMTKGPTIELANQPATGESYSVTSEIDGRPMNFNLPTREEEARLQGMEAGLKNDPLYQQQTKLETQRERAKQFSDELAYYRTMQKDAADNARAERIATGQQATALQVAQIRAAGQAAGKADAGADINMDTIQQTIQDIEDGALTQETFNRDKSLSNAAKLVVGNGLKAAGIQPLSDKQKLALESLGQVVPLIGYVDEYINELDSMPVGTGALTSNGRRLRKQIESGYGMYARGLSGVSSGRLPIFEAQKSLDAVVPSAIRTTKDNIKQANELRKRLKNNIEESLKGISPDRINRLIQERLTGHNLMPISDIHHLRAELSGKAQKPTAIPTGKVKVRNKSTGETGYMSPNFDPSKYEEIQ